MNFKMQVFPENLTLRQCALFKLTSISMSTSTFSQNFWLHSWTPYTEMTDPPVGLHPLGCARSCRSGTACRSCWSRALSFPGNGSSRPRPLLWRRRGVRLLPRLQSRPAGSDWGVAVWVESAVWSACSIQYSISKTARLDFQGRHYGAREYPSSWNDFGSCGCWITPSFHFHITLISDLRRTDKINSRTHIFQPAIHGIFPKPIGAWSLSPPSLWRTNPGVFSEKLITTWSLPGFG